MAISDNCLEADGILLSYQHRSILSNIYLKCYPGEIVGLLGRNGSGKSSLMKIIFGVLRAECQSVRVNGTYVYPAYLQYPRIKLLPQQSFLPGYLKVKEVYRLFITPGLSHIADQLPEIRNRWNNKLADLSGGEKRIIELLLLLYSEVDYLLLDEPFTHLAPVQVERLMALIREGHRNKGIIISDHNYRYVLALCSRLVLLANGRTNLVQDQHELVKWGYLGE